MYHCLSVKKQSNTASCVTLVISVLQLEGKTVRALCVCTMASPEDQLVLVMSTEHPHRCYPMISLMWWNLKYTGFQYSKAEVDIDSLARRLDNEEMSASVPNNHENSILIGNNSN
mmetsp:Transcript_14847/g.20242  ORF Transcript_14847/g.20242 Transcript_14847/m.20242 type:complete len:115 (-) Transcript_14847:33-377(-)